MSCEYPHTVHTIGHSTRTLGAFIDLLNAHKVEAVIDVRRWPASRRHPQFQRDALAQALKTERIDYIWRGDLGGFRQAAPDSPNTAWRVSTFRAYGDFMLTAEFATIMSELEKIAANQRIVIMCAEAVPWRCHRQLIADAFLVRHWEVLHIMNGGCREHNLPPFAQPVGKRIFYRGLL